MSESGFEIGGAGGVVERVIGGVTHFAIVHRPRYGDWTFPKGRLDPGETFEDAAKREVAEETGFEVGFGEEVGSTRYLDSRGRNKLVRYWRMNWIAGEFVSNEECDRLEWLPCVQALERLTYERDTELLRRLCDE